MSSPTKEAARTRMTESTRRVPLLLYGLLLVLAAYAPLVEARLVGEDWGVLAASVERSRDWFGATDHAAETERPLAALSLALTAAVAEPARGWSSDDAWRLRVENLLYLLLAGLGVSRFVRRGLQPWTGSEQAHAAGRAAALFFAVHPLAVSSVARLGSRGELIALALATWACTAFLWARQSGRAPRMLFALVLTFACAAASERAWFLPFVLAGLEYSSARRHRSRRMRLRTALTTLLVFGALLPLERALAALLPVPRGGALAGSSTFLAAHDPWDLGAVFAEKLGVLLLPVNTNTEGIVAPLGYVLAGAFLVLALQPAFVAARSAPRLWGRILLGWLLCVLIYQLPDAAVRVPPSELAAGHVLLVPALIAAIGLGIASTALSGIRRVLVPALLALPYAVLARANAMPWDEAGERVHELWRELVGAARAHEGARLLVVDPPAAVRGLEAFAPALDALLSPVYVASELGERAQPIEVRAIDLEGFFLLMRQEESRRLREEGLVVVLPARLAGDTSEEGHVWQRLAEPGAGDGREFWRKEGTSSARLALDPLVSRSVRVKSNPGTEPVRDPVLRWIARSARFSAGERTGTWIEGEDAPIACFDLSRDLSWLLGERVTSLYFTGVLISITSAEVTAEPPAIDLATPPRCEGDGWTFDLSRWEQPRALVPEGYWILGILDLERWRYHELGARPRPPRELFVPEAAHALAALAQDSAGPFAWSLEWRVSGVTLARASGRPQAGELSAPSR